MKILHYLLVFCLTSCAFKKEPIPSSVVESAYNIGISWKSDKVYEVKRSLTKMDDGYLSTPITLNNPIPSRLFITGNLNSNIFIESIEAIEKGKTFLLAYSLKENGIEIIGLRTILFDDKEQKITLNLKTSDGKTYLKIPIITLTKELTPTHLDISSFSQVRIFHAPNLRISLLRTFSIKNNKNTPIEIRIKKIIFGELKRYFTTYEVLRHECGHQQLYRNFFDIYPTRFFYSR